MKLKPHQLIGADWLAKKRFALLADEMRVGKTLTAIRASDLIEAKRILVVCPAVGRPNWARQWKDHQLVMRYTHTCVSRGTLTIASSLGGATVVITSYDLVTSARFPGHWDLIILDEAHYLRNCTAKRTRAILGRGGLAHRASRVWFLTGTPAVNHAAELWPMLHVCGQYPGTYEDFVRDYCTGYRSAYGFQITGSKNQEHLRSRLDGFILRRTFAEIAPELPPIEYSDYVVDGPSLTGEALLQDHLVREALRAKDPVSALEALAPAIATLRRVTGLAKVGATVDLVEHELSTGTHKIVLFAIHHEVIELLHEQLAAFEPAVVYGPVGPKSRQTAVERFQGDSACRVFIGQITAAGTALDLSAADDALFVEYSWVPGENAQAAMRIQNINAITPKFVRFLSLAGSIDEKVTRVYRRKTQDLGFIFD
jgi:SNF2 family DNA or RNA helicase